LNWVAMSDNCQCYIFSKIGFLFHKSSNGFFYLLNTFHTNITINLGAFASFMNWRERDSN
ncbi:hypothetical protein, partial [Flavobacterium frigidimaris]